MVQAEFELQLKVWEKVAVTKQMYMNAVTETLGLEIECEKDELIAKLKNNIELAKAAKEQVTVAREEASKAIAEMEKKLEAATKAEKLSEAAKTGALNLQSVAEKSLAAGREANAKDLKKVAAQLADAKKTIKSINNALADTPENVVKKLKSLKKEKFDEATARKKAEDDANRLRKEKKQLEADATESKLAIENAGKLVELYRKLHEQANSDHKQLEKLSENPEKLDEIAAIDESLLEVIEKVAPQDEEGDTKETAKKAKKENKAKKDKKAKKAKK